MSTASPIINLPFLYINGLRITNNVAAPTTQLDIGTGQCRDSTDIFDMTLSTAVTINAANTGINGIDTGTFAAAKVYYVYFVTDTVSANSSGCMISLSPPATGPLMPFGYGAFRWIGCVTTAAGGATFVLGYWSGNNNARRFTYDAPIATLITAGTSATYAAVVLTTLVPAVADTPVLFRAIWTANAAADIFNMQGGNSTGDAWRLYSQVAGGTALTTGMGTVLSQLVAGVPTSNYKVSAAGGVAINVAAYDYFI